MAEHRHIGTVGLASTYTLLRRRRRSTAYNIEGIYMSFEAIYVSIWGNYAGEGMPHILQTDRVACQVS